MSKKLSRRTRIILITISIILAIIGGQFLFIADKYLSPLQMFALILGIVAVASIIEIIGIAYEERHRAKNPQKSSSDLVGKKGIVIEDCSPEGRVKIGQEIWRAMTINGSTFKKDKEIVVQERHGLKLVVKPLSKTN